MPSKPPEPNLEVVWEPIKGSSQELAIDTRCHHTLYHGTRGPGKTITQLMRFRRRVGIGYGSFWRGVIFDKEYKNFADIIAQSKRFFSKFDDGAKFISSPSDLKWVWPTGEELLFRHVKKLSDYDNFHGHEYPFIGWNELTKQATAELYDKLMSTNRSSFTPERDTPRKADGTFDTPDGRPLPPIPLEVFSTTNPSGSGHNWVKRRFINCAKNGEVVRTKSVVFDPKKQEDVEVTKTQVAIFGSYRENIYLPAEYIAELDRLTNSDHNLKRAWLFGDWNVTAGGAIDDLWKRDTHIVPRFPIPKDWYIDRSMDWGSSHPFSVGWWAEANGEEVILPNGNRFCPAPGSLIQFAEWYGTAEIGTNKGLKLSAGDIAEGIKAREIEMMRTGWIRAQPWPGPADNQIRDVRESDVDTIEAKMSKVGIRWTESDKSPGSRRNGLQLVRDRLEAALRGEGPGLYFMSHCQASIETLPSLPRDDVKLDDVDTTAEDHCFVGSTKVCTLRGDFAISELVGKSGLVYSIGGELVEFHTVRKTRNAPCLKLTFSNGDEVICTHDHKFLTNNGWIEAQNLFDTSHYEWIENLKNNRRLHLVGMREAGEHDVFCLVAEKHHAFAIESGIIVHNCYDAVRYRCLKGNNRLSKQIKVKFAT